ncbi:hypothetical protein [Bosea sp. 124]|uniref:hypothetical protein n=1 Tax=Bosea sp. 124 TaxID=2135642 RepID=UPI000D3A7EC7|nr:hypothetical protein [Bosea sp. 124]PTM42720.1 hypothetical protein C8D03_4316 [Bosea sp. 124]
MLDRTHLPALHSLRLAAFALCAGAAMMAAPAPAKALDTDWHQACTFKNSPQGYGDMARERACIRQNDCASMADAHGATMMGMGCFGVSPSAPAVNADAAQPVRRR